MPDVCNGYSSTLRPMLTAILLTTSQKIKDDMLQVCGASSPALGPALAVPGPSQMPGMLAGIAPAPQPPSACPTSSQTFVCSLNGCNVSPLVPRICLI